MAISIGHQVMLLDKYTKQWLRHAFAELGVSPTEGMIIMQLSRDVDSEVAAQMKTHDALVKELHLDKGLTSRTIKAMEEKGLVTREGNPQDARSTHFELTPQAEQLLPDIVGVMARWDREVFGGLDESQIEAVSKTLDDLLARIMKASK